MPIQKKHRTRKLRLLIGLFWVGCIATLLALGGVWAYAGTYGLHVLFRHGGTWWLPVSSDSATLSPAMRLALGPAPVATPGDVTWRSLADGFEVADLAALVDGKAVDHVLLARIDPTRFRFVALNSSDVDKDLDQLMARRWWSMAVTTHRTARRTHPS